MKLGPFNINQCHTGDALTMLKRIPDGHPDKAMEIGSEKTPQEYVSGMVAVFREVRRVLRKDGVLWINIGDSFATGGGPCKQALDKLGERLGCGGGEKHSSKECGRAPVAPGLKPKDLVGIPWMQAFALRDDGWYLRRDVIWAKKNPMPESVTDRPTTAHEYVFLLSKSGKYHYDAEAVREKSDPWRVDICAGWQTGPGAHSVVGHNQPGIHKGPKFDKKNHGSGKHVKRTGRNLRSVWSIATQSFPDAHFATFPEELARRCILAGTSPRACGICSAPWERVVERKAMEIKRSERGKAMGEYGRTAASGTMVSPAESRTTGFRPTCDHDNAGGKCVVLDPFIGSGTVGKVCEDLGLSWLGFDLNPEYEAIQRRRLVQAGLFSRPAATVAEGDS